MDRTQRKYHKHCNRRNYPRHKQALPRLISHSKLQTGEEYTLSELKGNAVLVNLWATWCPPCRAEMPAIEKMYQEYKDQGFIVLAVNMTYQDDPANVVPFIQEYGLTFPILLEETGDVAPRINCAHCRLHTSSTALASFRKLSSADPCLKPCFAHASNKS